MPHATAADAHTPPFCIGTNDYADDRTYGSSLATSPVIDLAGTTDPQLSFWMYSDIEDNWDRTRLEISVNGGACQLPCSGTYTIQVSKWLDANARLTAGDCQRR